MPLKIITLVVFGLIWKFFKKKSKSSMIHYRWSQSNDHFVSSINQCLCFFVLFCLVSFQILNQIKKVRVSFVFCVFKFVFCESVFCFFWKFFFITIVNIVLCCVDCCFHLIIFIVWFCIQQEKIINDGP